MNRIGLVGIGQNEGQRLRQYLVSVVGKVGQMVDVASSSIDSSVRIVRSLGLDVVELGYTLYSTSRAP